MNSSAVLSDKRISLHIEENIDMLLRCQILCYKIGSLPPNVT